MHFNNGVPIKDRFKKEIVNHFTYKWANDLNQFIDDPTEEAIFLQLPEHV